MEYTMYNSIFMFYSVIILRIFLNFIHFFFIFKPDKEADSGGIGSDTSFIAKSMFNAEDKNNIFSILKNVEGPYAFIYYQVIN